MNVRSEIKDYIAAQSEPKQSVKQGSECTLPNERFGIGCEEVHTEPCFRFMNCAAYDVQACGYP